MMHAALTQQKSDIGWTRLYQDLADAIASYAKRSDQSGLFEVLARALNTSMASFPIMNAGEDLDCIDPFTFFASFNWSYCAEQREELLDELICLLGLEASYSSEQKQGHGYFVDERELRFFSTHERSSTGEIDMLWTLFSAALAYADTQDTESRVHFVEAYDTVLNRRIKGAPLITTALQWVRPSFYLPVNERIGSFVASVLDYDPAFFGQTPKAADYLQFLQACNQALENRAFGPDISTIALLAQASWQATEPASPSIDTAKTQLFLEECCTNIKQIHEDNLQLWRAVACFNENWDAEADDVTAMLKASLAEHGTLLATSNLYNPYWEILRLSRNDPEAVRDAFEGLFDEHTALCKRLIVFEEAIATLYARHRESMIRAYAKRSSHGNYTAAATYLFLRYPATSFLYSPLRINALVPKVGYNATIRISRPESVEQYYDLCTQLLDQTLSNKDLITAANTCISQSETKSDPSHHLLLEDIINSTTSTRRTTKSTTP